MQFRAFILPSSAKLQLQPSWLSDILILDSATPPPPPLPPVPVDFSRAKLPDQVPAGWDLPYKLEDANLSFAELKIKMLLVATNVVARRPPECRQISMYPNMLWPRIIWAHTLFGTKISFDLKFVCPKSCCCSTTSWVCSKVTVELMMHILKVSATLCIDKFARSDHCISAIAILQV